MTEILVCLVRAPTGWATGWATSPVAKQKRLPFPSVSLDVREWTTTQWERRCFDLGGATGGDTAESVSVAAPHNNEPIQVSHRTDNRAVHGGLMDSLLVS